jgi:hypothetical protein
MRPCLRVAATRAAGGYCSTCEPFEQRRETVCDKSRMRNHYLFPKEERQSSNTLLQDNRLQIAIQTLLPKSSVSR